MTTAIFIRHSLPEDILHKLWNDRLIAIQYIDIPSTNPNDYEGAGRNSLKLLWECCEKGALVGATYRKIIPSEILVGRIEAGTGVQIEKIAGYYHKTARLADAHPISYRDYPLLNAVQPKYRTMSRWKNAKGHLEAILEGRPLERRVESLHPSQLEVLCYEYLRITGWLDALLLPIGRGLMDIDIYGIRHPNQLIVAQVTQSHNREEVGEKRSKLKNYQENAQLFLFAPESVRSNDPAIEFVSIEDVFNYLDSGQAGLIYQHLITEMLAPSMKND